MKWILIVIAASGHVSFAEFNDKMACEMTASMIELKATLRSVSQGFTKVHAYCAPDKAQE